MTKSLSGCCQDRSENEGLGGIGKRVVTCGKSLQSSFFSPLRASTKTGTACRSLKSSTISKGLSRKRVSLITRGEHPNSAMSQPKCSVNDSKQSRKRGSLGSNPPPPPPVGVWDPQGREGRITSSDPCAGSLEKGNYHLPVR